MEVRGPAGNVSQTFKGREGGRGCQEVAKTFTTQMLPPPNTKKTTWKVKPKEAGGGSLGPGRALGPGGGQGGRGAKRLGLTHTHPRG